jgi:CheY-like chemotaxis protein
MATVSREEIRSLVIQAFRQRGIAIRHLEILPLAHDGGWTIGPAMLPSMSAHPVKAAANDITYELGVLYQLERRERGERRAMIDGGHAESRPIKVLVVADNALAADLIAEALAVEGCLVVGPVGTVEDGLIIASRADISGALLDIDLHGERSFPIAYRLRDQGVPFAFVTGHAEMVVPADLRDVPRFLKPFTPWELASAALAAFARPS